MTKTLAPPRRSARLRPRDILEIASSGAAHPVDRDRGVIRNVKILGVRSRNGGVYPASAMASAKGLYDGARVNIDHPDRSTPDQERTFGDWFGVLQNVRLEKDGLYGDLSYLTSHPLAGQVCEAAERFPASFGLSHNAQVTEAMREGQTVYEAIHRVRSVDIVCKPATTRGIFEAVAPADMTGVGGSTNADDASADAADGGVSSEPSGAGDSADDDASPSDAVDWDAFVGQMRAIVDSQTGPLTQLHAGIEVMFGLIGGAAADAGDDAEEDDAERDDGPVAEATRTNRADRGQAAGASLESAAARNLLEAIGLEVDAARVAALTVLANPKHRRALLADWLESAAPRRSAADRPTAPPQASLLAAPAGSASRPRSSEGSGAASSATPEKSRASRWDDPKIATMNLLSR